MAVYKVSINLVGLQRTAENKKTDFGPYRVATGHMSKAEYEALPETQNENIVPMQDAVEVSRQKLEFDIGEPEYTEILSGDRKVFVWARPSANCSVVDMAKGLGVGLSVVPAGKLSFKNHDSVDHGYGGNLISIGNFIAVKGSPITFTAQKMSDNIKDGIIQKIKDAPWANNARTERPDTKTKESIIGTMGHPDSGLRGAVMDVLSGLREPNVSIAASGSWDLKPEINKSWGARLRFGNENWVLRYDHLSNIHYGYVLGACGIDLEDAVRMAGMNPASRFIDNKEDPSDEIATHIGLALYKSYPTGINANQLWMELKRYRTQKYVNTTTNVGGSYSLWSIQKINDYFE